MDYDFCGAEAFSTRKNEEVPFAVILPKQTHSDRVVAVKSADIDASDLDGVDALVTNVPMLGIGVKTADCVPILLCDEVRGAVAAIHSGWRGTVGRIAQKAIAVMMREYGTNPQDLKAIVGPSIGVDNFQVGPEVVEEFRQAGFPMQRVHRNDGERVADSMRGGDHLDLWQANVWLLEECGVKPDNINVCGICTYDHHEAFYSARHDGNRMTDRIINGIRLL